MMQKSQENPLKAVKFAPDGNLWYNIITNLMKGTFEMTAKRSKMTSFIALFTIAVMAFVGAFSLSASDVQAYSNSKKTKKRAKKVYDPCSQTMFSKKQVHLTA